MKVALLTPRYAPHTGGVETHVAELARRVAAQGNHVEVLTQESCRGLSAVEVVEGVTIRRFRDILPGPTCAFAPGVWSYLARHGMHYDVVHAHSYHALPALGAALAGCQRLVFTPHYHGTGHTPLRRLLHVPYRLLGTRIFAQASQVICNSEAEAILVRRDFPHTARRITVIYPGVDMTPLRAAEPYPEDRTIILTGGRLEEYKNVHVTVKAMAHLDLSFALRVTGNGPARPALEDLAARLGLQERIAFLGRVDDTTLRRWLRTAAVYVSMSRHEAYGLAIADALAAGTSVVAADIPAYREIAHTAGCLGVALVPLDTRPVALARVIRDMVARGAQITGMPQLLSWDEVAAQTHSVYRAVVRPVVRCARRC